MNNYLVLVAAGLLTVAGLTGAAPLPPSPPQIKKEPLADRVRKSIDQGVAYLRGKQDRTSGSWESGAIKEGHNGGSTALVVLALLNSGVKARDPAIEKGLDYLMRIKNPGTYVRALQTMAFVEHSIAVGREGLPFEKEYLEKIQENVERFLKKRIIRDGKLEGWSYDLGLETGKADNSNSQYAMLGLYAGKLGGAKIDKAVWEEIRAFYKRTQNEDGGWGYEASGLGPFGKNSKLTMTTAGLCGLLIAGMELNASREVLLDDGTAQNCGQYMEEESVRAALRWISNSQIDRFQLEVPNATFYNLYGIECAGRLSGLRFFHAHDWYREGSEFLVKNQHNNGQWYLASRWDTKEYQLINTAFALLFLSKGRTPILISKLAHGAMPRTANDQDWNNDRNDLRHLVNHASKELFKRQPLAWQTFDMIRAVEIQQGAAVVLTPEDEAEITSELLQSPIAYMNGHKSPEFRFTDQEKDLLKKYVESGGFILAEACCGSKDFDKGFKKLVKIWDQELEDLPADHPVWSMYARVPPGSFGLKGLRMGCKWVLIYSPQDLSCRWEIGNPEDPRCALAFKMGLNIIAYATGNEPPRPRLTKVDLPVIKDDRALIPPGVLKVGQLNHGGDWKLAPRAMSNVMVNLHKKFGVDVTTKWEEVNVGTKKIIDHKFIYMHGRNHFEFAKDDLKELRFNLETGGLLFADACCGSKKFDESFRAFIKELLPKHKLGPIPPGDRLYSKDINGTALTPATIRGRQAKQGPVEKMNPQLEGIKIDNRWVVIYSRLDVGCALERHQSPDCPGYTTESAMRIATAAVLYQLMPDLKGH